MRIARARGRAEASPNMTPLLDMMFILVIFFLATSRFQQEERDENIQLVKTRSKLPIATTTDVLIINIDREGTKVVDGRARDLPELEEVVRQRLEERPDIEVVVRADRRAVVGHLAQTLEICHRLGVRTPKVSYETGSP